MQLLLWIDGPILLLNDSPEGSQIELALLSWIDIIDHSLALLGSDCDAEVTQKVDCDS